MVEKLKAEGKSAPKHLCYELKSQLKVGWCQLAFLATSSTKKLTLEFLFFLSLPVSGGVCLLAGDNQDEAFSQTFVSEGGLEALMQIATQASSGNTQAYALSALCAALSHKSGCRILSICSRSALSESSCTGLEGILASKPLLEQLVGLADSPFIAVSKCSPS